MIDFIEKIPTSEVTGSTYNPRVITEGALEKLQYSIKRFGMVKPLIVNAANNVIVAGHQRKKAAEAIGMPINQIANIVSHDRELTENEKSGLSIRRSLFAVREIKAGEAFTEENVRSIRPSNGLKPKYYSELLQKRAKRSYAYGEPITEEEIS